MTQKSLPTHLDCQMPVGLPMGHHIASESLRPEPLATRFLQKDPQSS
jgi:hypothetical protein